MKEKQGVILLEAILSIALFMVIISSATSVFLKLQERSKRVNEQTIALLTLEATKQFLVNNQNLNELIYSDGSLFYKGDLLLKDVSKYSFSFNQKITTIDICINDNKVCAKWKIKN